MENIEQIGVLLVHGIGDQNRYEHLAHTVGSFAKRLSVLPHATVVSVQFDPGVNSETWEKIKNLYYENLGPTRKIQTSSPASILVRFDEPRSDPDLILINFHEVWWKDFGKKPSAISTIKFWLWAISFSGTKGKFPSTDFPNFLIPNNDSSKNKRIGIYRIVLFLLTATLFILLLPVHIILQLAAIFPLIASIHLFRTGYIYLSSVQMYQEGPREYRDRPDDFDQPRRFGIQRRMVEGLVEMATANYDRWYILAHSLGSIIAFKALNSSDASLARLLRANSWFGKASSLVRSGSPSINEPDAPRRPVWLNEGDSLDSAQLFQRLRGFISYGTPLEIFAHTWPNLVHERMDIKGEYEWVNLHDPIDIISSPIRSFGRAIRITNFPCKVRNWIFSAHTDYFRAKKSEGPVIDATINWLMRPDLDFHTAANMAGLQDLSERGTAIRSLFLALQCFLLVIFGCVVWPFAAQITTRPLSALLSHIYTIFEIQDGWNPFEEATSLLKGLTINSHVNSLLNIGYMALWICGIVIASALIRRLIGRFTSP